MNTIPMLQQIHSPGGVVTKDQVINRISLFLAKRGWAIIDVSGVMGKGDDIVATKAGLSFHIEAKGEGSAKKDSANFAKRFTSTQVTEHVARAVYRGLCMRGKNRITGVALPDTLMHRRCVDALPYDLEMVFFWASTEDKTVTAELGANRRWEEADVPPSSA